LRIEVSRFPDGRLKVLRIHKTTDSNIRVGIDEVSICSKLEEIGLEKDVIDAIDAWNLMRSHPKPKDSIQVHSYSNL
jgi:hypothetical protein